MDHFSMSSDKQVTDFQKWSSFVMAHLVHNLVQWLHKHLLAAALCYGWRAVLLSVR